MRSYRLVINNKHEHDTLGKLHLQIKPLRRPTLENMLRHLDSNPNNTLYQIMLIEYFRTHKKRREKTVRSIRIPEIATVLGIKYIPNYLNEISSLDQFDKATSPNMRVRSTDKGPFLTFWDNLHALNQDAHLSLEQSLTYLNNMKRGPTPKLTPFSIEDIAKPTKNGSPKTRVLSASFESTIQKIEQCPILDLVDMNKLHLSQQVGSFHSQVMWEVKARGWLPFNDYDLRGQVVSCGKGISDEMSITSATMELVERFSGLYGGFIDNPSNGPEILTGRRSDFDSALDLSQVNLTCPYKDEPLTWVWGETATPKGLIKTLVPVQLTYFLALLNEIRLTKLSTNGLASGNTLPGAKCQALLEIIERDSLFNGFFDESNVFFPVSSDPSLNKFLKQYEQYPIEIVDLTTELGVYSFMAYFEKDYKIHGGFGAHLDPRIALTRAITELSPDIISSNLPPPKKRNLRNFDDFPNYSTGNSVGDLALLEKLLFANGMNPVYVDLTREEIGIPVVRAIIPELAVCKGYNPRRAYRLVAKGF